MIRIPLLDNARPTVKLCNNFNRFWEVHRTDIDNFIAAFNTNNGSIPLAAIPNAILQWPGKNNPHFNDFQLPANQSLAPFWDNNEDGNYNPLDGDYPVIEASSPCSIADQMIWWVFNDSPKIFMKIGVRPLI